MTCSWDKDANIDNASRLVREAATSDANLSMTFYGNSFICDHTGEIQGQADDNSETVLVAAFDLEEISAYRAQWGLFRDRRPELYHDLTQHTPGQG